MRPAEIPIVYKTEDIVRFCKTQCPNTDQAKEIWQGMASMIWYLIQTTQSKELSQEYQQISQLAREYNIEIPSKKMSSLYNYMKQINEIYRSRMQIAARDAIKKGRSPIAKRAMARFKKPLRPEAEGS